MEYLAKSPHLTRNYQESPAIPLIVSEGDTKRGFYVHETLLTQTSEFFRISLQNRAIEGKRRTYRCSHYSSYAFHLFVQYLYNGDYNVMNAWPSDHGGNQQSWFEMHADAYVLGVRLAASSFKKFVVFKLASVLMLYHHEPTMRTLLSMSKTVYDGTTEIDGKAMRDLLATYFSSRLGIGPCNLGVKSKGWWTEADIKESAEIADNFTNQDAFKVDVARKSHPSPKIEVVAIMGLHYTKP